MCECLCECACVCVCVCVCVCACVCVCVHFHSPLRTQMCGSKFDVDPLCPLSSSVTAVHLLQGLRCVLSLPVPLGTFNRYASQPGLNCSCKLLTKQPCPGFCIRGKINYLTPPYISQSIFSMLGPITPSRKTTLYVIPTMTSILQLHTEHC